MDSAMDGFREACRELVKISQRNNRFDPAQKIAFQLLSAAAERAESCDVIRAEFGIVRPLLGQRALLEEGEKRVVWRVLSTWEDASGAATDGRLRTHTAEA